MSIHDRLVLHAQSIKATPLSTLLKQNDHCLSNLASLPPHLTFDYSRQHFTQETLGLLVELAKERKLEEKIKKMVNGELINSTEQRAVLHMALRSNPQSHLTIPRIVTNNDIPHQFKFANIPTDNVVQPVLDQIQQFSSIVRNGEYFSPSGKPFDTFIVVGIGGSYLGTQFVHDAMRYDKVNGGYDAGQGKTMRFIANVDPLDFHRATDNINYETTMIIIISKTFTTAETIKNALLMKDWLLQQYQTASTRISDQDIISKHFIACSTAIDKATNFGIDATNIFPFWDWVGGRYSVTSCVGILPLSLYFGYNLVQQFLAGCHDMDKHFMSAPIDKNIPILLGLLGIWNSQYLNYPSRCIIPYSECLASFVTHIQQVDMESNGKRVTINGEEINHNAGEIDFGTPGTNSQHSYFQLFHQGNRIIPIDFIGFIASQCQDSSNNNNTNLSSHDELMCNFFAQPDALAFGTDGDGNPHRMMPGDKPSSILLFSQLTFYTVGLLLSLYEHRTAVQGFMWDINSFDQYGVELGKALATNVRNYFTTPNNNETQFIGNTQRLLQLYLDSKQ